MVPWTDLESVLADTEGKACLYGYLRAMDAGDPAPRRLHRYIELLEELALFRRQVDDAQRRADHILATYVTAEGALGGLWRPSEEERQQLRLGTAAGAFDGVEAAARDALTPVVPQFLRDVKKGEKSVKQRVKESGYAAFMAQLDGKGRRGRCVESSCGVS